MRANVRGLSVSFVRSNSNMGKTAKLITEDSSIDNEPVASQKKIDIRYFIFALLALAVPLIVSIVVIAQRRWTVQFSLALRRSQLITGAGVV